MLNHQLLTELSRQRRRDVAREVALIGTALDQEPERNPQITIV